MTETLERPSSTPLRRFTITSIEGEKPCDEYPHRVGSEYVEREWLSFIRPDAFVFARRVDQILHTDGKNQVDIQRWADELGIKHPEDILRAANRLIRFGLAEWSERDKTLLLSRYWPNVATAIRTPQHRAALMGLPDVEVTTV